MDDVSALWILTWLFVGIGIGWVLHADVRPALARWIDRRDARGR